ncbi:MAG: C39 family peptidase [Oscillospiraceae bacterium]|nr:C39 family peptidase [Oscillospiraceae bacterium]
MFGIAVLAVFIMTIGRLAGIVKLFDKEPEEKPTTVVTIGDETGENDPETEGEEDNEGDVAESTMDYDLYQYADHEGAAGKIYAHMEAYPEAAYVLRNLDLYPEDLLTFVARFPEAMSYAASYLDFDRMNIQQEIDLSQEVTLGEIPLLIQWDTRWGYVTYGDGMIGYTGCGPTCLSMVSIYYNGWSNNDPAAIAKFAEANGYYVNGSGSSWTLMSQASVNFGLSASEVILDENAMAKALGEGKPVICAMGPGVFTDNGHYIVLTGYENGAFTIHDPNSRANSARTWTFSELKSQIKNIWSFTKA